MSIRSPLAIAIRSGKGCINAIRDWIRHRIMHAIEYREIVFEIGFHLSRILLSLALGIDDSLSVYLSISISRILRKKRVVPFL